jgi:hypothetical protein
MMKGLETRYIANARNKGDVVDMTPAGLGQARGSKRAEGKEDESEAKAGHK